MNDMEWGGGTPPEGPFPAGDLVSDADRDAVQSAIERALQPNDLDEVEFASRLLWSYVADLQRDYTEMAEGRDLHIDADALKKAVKSARDVRAACEHLKQEREKVEKLRRNVAGNVGGGSLDLDAARDEIGRRLACLRRAEPG